MDSYLSEVAPGVLAWVQPDGSWWLNNAGAVYGRDGDADGVVLVDTCATARRTRAFLDAVGAATGDAPIRLAATTHLHGDHAYGNALLPEGTPIAGHTATRAGLLADFLLADTPPIWSPSPDWGITAIRPPTVVFSDALTLYAAGQPIELRHPGYPAHTPGDVVAWLPGSGVLFAGDLVFHEVTPLVVMGSLDGALRSLDWLASFPVTVIVPGHGPLLDAARRDDVLDAHARYYRFVLATARQGLADGLAPLDAARKVDLGEFAGWPDAERIVLNLHRAYAELAGTELDLMAAFGDALALNGGPLRCAL